MTKIFFCADEQALLRLGALLGCRLFSGANVLLSGSLGAGKTTLAKGIASGLDIIPDKVTSPTFALLNIYNGRESVRHFDLYRLRGEGELAAFGFDQHLEDAGINIVEWGDLFPQAMPPERLAITLCPDMGGRRVVFEPVGSAYENICREVFDAYTGD